MNEPRFLPVVPTDHPPACAASLVHDFTPELISVGAHQLCPGCGEPMAIRAVAEAVAELGLTRSCIAVFGIGCSTAFSNNLDIEVVQALHGRAPSVATGITRMRPDVTALTVQGDGDMVNEGLQEVLHAAARGERITCFMLNNGVFGETGGQMTATTVLGQRTKNSPEGRDARHHGHPIRLADLVATLDGAVYVARGAVDTAVNVQRTKRMVLKALQAQKRGFALVEVLTMCPTGWAVDTTRSARYMADHHARIHSMGVLKDTGGGRSR
ncbi:thiamine pyrophosphate-dependent enzyme [Streptomyces bambusae]|uniref:thiamine pyrophosphate-dependent enzyme n=1 Tax=Streptomyces bambusae TaxID=1550616 RepID=UPI001CFE6593|nr:thiamine pyrophosphate-dependent enzyme [Streptomyces bambusae]MCB5164710.1 thiamine pyrophosphate-dependent enzyme [Streptomyces bambusae]